MLASIVIKGIAAVIEIATQMLLTNGIGVDGFGEYAFLISVIELFYFALFSGGVKLNAFYLSTEETGIVRFKKKYILRYVFPCLVILSVAALVGHYKFGVMSVVILFIYYMSYDYSSVFLARKKQMPALFGEYLLGRVLVLIGVLVLLRMGKASDGTLLSLYGIQYALIVVFFLALGRNLNRGPQEADVSIRKLWEYQKSDIALAIILYSPTILQYIFGGAFTAGFTGIIALVKKFINFVTGPTAKIFLPEFSRLYKTGEKGRIQTSYLTIVRIQMVFTGTAGALLIGFPKLILSKFSPELLPYSDVFSGVAICLLVIASLGPVAGLLQMTGSERICNINQWISIGIMVCTWFILKSNPLFAVFGLAVQALSEGLLQYYAVCKWFKKLVIPVKNFIVMWAPIVIVRLAAEFGGWQESLLAMLLSVVAVFICNSLIALRDPMVKETIKGMLSKTGKDNNEDQDR